MSHKTLLKRFRGEASTSTAEDPGEREHAENIPMEIAEPDEPDPPPRRPRERFSHNRLKKLNKKYSMHHGAVEYKQKKYDWQYQCQNCVKRIDDIVRKVHDDLLAGRITMVGVTLTRKVPFQTRNRRVQTSPERMQHVAEEMRPMPVWMQSATEERNAVREEMHFMPERMQTATEERNAVREEMHFMPERVQTATEERNAVREQIDKEQMHTMPAWMQIATEERNAVREQRHFLPAWMQTATEQRNAVREQMHFMPERMQPVLEREYTLPEPLDLMLKEMRAMSERMVPDTESMHHAPEQMQHIPDWVETSPERDNSRDNSLTRDFYGGTDSSQLEGGCQCHNCLFEHNADGNARVCRTKPRNHASRIHLNRALAPCKDGALTDLHHHILAGDNKTPGARYVGILASLHDQGPCEVPCKLRSDIVWMHDHIPVQGETQTDLAGDDDVRDQGTQTNLTRSIGIQNGKALAQIMTARLSHFKSASTQINLPQLSLIHRPVGIVLPALVRNRF